MSWLNVTYGEPPVAIGKCPMNQNNNGIKQPGQHWRNLVRYQTEQCPLQHSGSSGLVQVFDYVLRCQTDTCLLSKFLPTPTSHIPVTNMVALIEPGCSSDIFIQCLAVILKDEDTSAKHAIRNRLPLDSFHSRLTRACKTTVAKRVILNHKNAKISCFTFD